MPKSALPGHYHKEAKGTGTDWDNPIQGWMNKAWFAYGPRATEQWAKWREFPKTLFAWFGPGFVRFETELWERDTAAEIVLSTENHRFIVNTDFGNYYLSAIQYYVKWHFAVQWPLHIQFHYYLDDVPLTLQGAKKRRVIFVRFGSRRDADKVYWCPSLFVGLTWN